MNPLASFPHGGPRRIRIRDADGQGGGHQDAPLKITSTQQRKGGDVLRDMDSLYTYNTLNI
jgi:hypothetical protein